MLNRTVFAIAICAMLLAAVSHAASFCIGGPGLPPQCLYEDVKDCRRAANSQNTSCLVNPDAYIAYIGEARYCRIGSTHVAQCLYVDRSKCNADARAHDEVCFDHALINDADNPYRLDNRLQY